MVGEGSQICEKVSIKKSIIGKHVTIGDRVKIANSVIMDHVTVKDGSVCISIKIDARFQF